MKQKKQAINLSLIVLTRNEEKIVKYNLEKIINYLRANKLIKKFEVLVCDFSEDSTPKIVKSMKKTYRGITYVDVGKRGIGAGIKAGIDAASFEFAMFYPIDMAWSIDIIEKSVKAMLDGSDVVLGSRGLSESNVSRPLPRAVFSIGYNFLVNTLFQLNIRDTQGTVAFKRYDIMKFRDELEDDGAFLQTELLIYAKLHNLKIKEMPSNVIDLRKESKVSPLQYSMDMTAKIIQKFWKLNFS